MGGVSHPSQAAGQAPCSPAASKRFWASSVAWKTLDEPSLNAKKSWAMETSVSVGKDTLGSESEAAAMLRRGVVVAGTKEAAAEKAAAGLERVRLGLPSTAGVGQTTGRALRASRWRRMTRAMALSGQKVVGGRWNAAVVMVCISPQCLQTERPSNSRLKSAVGLGDHIAAHQLHALLGAQFLFRELHSFRQWKCTRGSLLSPLVLFPHLRCQLLPKCFRS